MSVSQGGRQVSSANKSSTAPTSPQDGRLVSSARMSSTAPTSPASPNAKPLKSILKGAAPSPRLPSASNTLLSGVGSLLFHENNLESGAGTARSRVTWSKDHDGHLDGDWEPVEGALKSAVSIFLLRTVSKRSAETRGACDAVYQNICAIPNPTKQHPTLVGEYLASHVCMH